MKQMSFAAPVYRNKGKKTKRETFFYIGTSYAH